MTDTVGPDDPRPVPHDPSAEAALLGAMLLSREAVREAAPLVVGDDFYRRGNAVIFNAILELDAAGQRIDAVSIADTLNTNGTLDLAGGAERLHELQNQTPTISNAGRYAAMVVRHSRLRLLVMYASSIVEGSLERGADPDRVLDRASAELANWRLLPRDGAIPKGLWRMPDFLADLVNFNDAGVVEEREWIVPGMLRAGWRAVVVASEGTGKSTVLRQATAAVASGLHPFCGSQRIPPQRTLTVDAENPVDVIEHQAQLIDSTSGLPLSQNGDWWLWHAESGLDLTQRASQARFERVLEVVRPKLVAMGPAYKLYPVRQGEDWSTPTLTFLRFLHEMAVRYGFAILVEHHAPKGSSGSRDLFPAGASEWLRWPEFGIKLSPDRSAGKDEQNRPLAYIVGRFRGDRLPACWPIKLIRRVGPASHGLPWEGVFPDGTF